MSIQFNEPDIVHHFLENSASRYPEKVAFVHEDVRETYHNINIMADKVAFCLIDTGLKKGHRVVMLFENCLEYVVSYYGILKAGGVAVPFSSELKPDSIKPLLDEIEADVMITSGRFERMLKAAKLETFSLKTLIITKSKINWADLSVNKIDFEQIINEDTSERSLPEIHPEDLSSIIYTSGSTGTPKGVMLTHKNIVANTKSICSYLKLSEYDTQMVVLPFFYVMGKSLLNTHFYVGGTVVVNNKFAYPASVIQQMIDEKVTGFSGVPSTFAYLIHRSPLKSRIQEIKTLRYISQAGGHMASLIKKELFELIPSSVDIFIMYGATEASARLSYLEPSKLLEKTDSIGKAIPGVELKILDNNGNVVVNGNTGELVGSGDNIMKGYWKDPELTSKVIDNNGYHTGDLCYQDEDGFFYLVGRKDNLLKVGGHRINPQEIEDAIMATDLVIENVVLSQPDELLGNILIAVAATKNEQCTPKDIISACSVLLPKFKLPSKVITVRSLPKRANGKIDKIKCFGFLSKNGG